MYSNFTCTCHDMPIHIISHNLYIPGNVLDTIALLGSFVVWWLSFTASHHIFSLVMKQWTMGFWSNKGLHQCHKSRQSHVDSFDTISAYKEGCQNEPSIPFAKHGNPLERLLISVNTFMSCHNFASNLSILFYQVIPDNINIMVCYIICSR